MKSRLAYAVYNETSTGTTLRYLEKLGELCNSKGAFFIADAVSILGGDELPVDKWGIDICVTASQKALAAPPGVSPISISDKAKKYLKSNPPPTQYFNLARYFKYFEENFETPFTPALPLFFAFNEALDMVLEEGLETRIRRHATCADAFYSSLGAIGFKPFAKLEARSNVVIAFNYMDGMDDSKFRTSLSKQFKVLVAGGFGKLKGKVFRIGCMGEVNKYHVMRTISSINSVTSMLNAKTNDEPLGIAAEKLKAIP